MSRAEQRIVRIGNLTVAALAVALLANSLRAENWPQFRGPNALGYAHETNLPLTWNGKSGENILWKTPLAKADNAYSSPVVWGERAFLTYALNQPVEHHVLCFDRKTGKELWNSKVEPGPLILKDVRGGYGAPTPATDGENVFVVFGSSVIAALDYNGKVVWRKEITPYNFDVAVGSSPIVYRDSVVLLCDQVNKTSSLTALNKQTGAIKWRQERPKVNFAHSTPAIIQVDGKDQLLVSASNALQGMDPETGTMIWWCSAYGDASSPAYAGNLIFSDSGRGGKAIAVDPRGQGDITKTNLKWTYPQIPEGLSSTIIGSTYPLKGENDGVKGEPVPNLVLRTHNPETLKCIDLATGQLLFAERLPGISTWASPFADDLGRVYFASAGKTYVIAPAAKLEILATNDLGEDSRASAAVSDGQIFIRGNRNLYCIAKQKRDSGGVGGR